MRCSHFSHLCYSAWLSLVKKVNGRYDVSIKNFFADEFFSLSCFQPTLVFICSDQLSVSKHAIMTFSINFCSMYFTQTHSNIRVFIQVNHSLYLPHVVRYHSQFSELSNLVLFTIISLSPLSRITMFRTSKHRYIFIFLFYLIGLYWKQLFIFHTALIPLGNVWINSRSAWIPYFLLMNNVYLFSCSLRSHHSGFCWWSRFCIVYSSVYLKKITFINSVIIFLSYFVTIVLFSRK